MCTLETKGKRELTDITSFSCYLFKHYNKSWARKETEKEENILSGEAKESKAKNSI